MAPTFGPRRNRLPRAGGSEKPIGFFDHRPPAWQTARYGVRSVQRSPPSAVPSTSRAFGLSGFIATT